jgi:hypothetical protein
MSKQTARPGVNDLALQDNGGVRCAGKRKYGQKDKRKSTPQHSKPPDRDSSSSNENTV